jgi:DNA-binding MarR family transcriptional regulator
MTRHTVIQISTRDLRIMKYLQKNGSSYGVKIANDIGLTIWYAFHHLQKLENQDIVKKGEKKRNLPYELTRYGEALTWYLSLPKGDKISLHEEYSK